MTIVIPTAELVGILTDTIPFAATDKDLPTINAIRLEWDGQQLHAMATDRYVIGWSTYDPDDAPDDDQQEDLFTKWGGGDQPWAAVVPLDDAKDVVTVFKLGPKEGWTPIAVDLIDGYRLKIVRARETGHSAITQVVETAGTEFPNLRKLLTDANLFEPVDGLSYDPKKLATFAKVRPRGPMRLTFTGEERPTHVSIGDRFTGAIMPVREKADDDTPTQAGDR